MPGILIGTDGLWERSASPIAGTPDYTVLGYLRVSALPSGNEMILWGEPSTGTYFIEGLALRSDGSARVEYYNAGGGGWSGQNIAMGGGGQPALFAHSTWYAVAIVRDGDDLYIYRRVDGGGTELLATINTSQTSRPSFATYRGVAGAHAQDYSYQLVRMYSRALTESEVEAEWDSTTPDSSTNLEADYQFVNDGTSGTRRADSSGNGRTLYAEVDSDYGASDLPLVFDDDGPTITEAEAHSTDLGCASSVAAMAMLSTATATDSDTASAQGSILCTGEVDATCASDAHGTGAAAFAGQSHVADRAAASSRGASTLLPSAHATVDGVAVASGAMVVAGHATSTSPHVVSCLASLVAAGAADSTDRTFLAALATAVLSALADSTDRALAVMTAQLNAVIQAEAHSVDGDVGAAVVRLVVPAIASSTDRGLAGAVAAALSSAVAPSVDRATADAIGRIVVAGIAESIQDALAVARWIEPSDVPVSYQTKSRAVDTRARSAAAPTAARSKAA